MSIQPYQPSALPPRLDEVFNWLQSAGLKDAVLFGAALSNADCGRPLTKYELMFGDKDSLPTEKSEFELFKTLTDSRKGRLSSVQDAPARIQWSDGLSCIIFLNNLQPPTDAFTFLSLLEKEDTEQELDATMLIAMDLSSQKVFASDRYMAHKATLVV